MTSHRVHHLQVEVNKTLDNAELDWLQIPADGRLGPLTRKHARLAGSWQGLSSKQLHRITDGHIGPVIYAVLAHNRTIGSDARLERHKDRLPHFKTIREQHAIALKKAAEKDTGITTLDGKPIAAWIAHDILIPARELGYWHGYVISGYRTPAYSRSLCYAMCGASSCPGRCAGEASRHSQYVRPDGACDLTDPAGAIAYARHKGIEFHGAGEVLSSDYPHFSTWGN